MLKTLLNTIPRPILIKVGEKVRPAIKYFYKGNKFTDPIDGFSFRKMLPYGYDKIRENALSPSTFSLERHRLMWLYLQNETDFFTKKLKVLHIAPEQCFIQRFKAQSNIDYISCDLYSPIADVKADICDLPFKDESFDIIFCNHVLEHITDDKKAMSELHRVMKPKGWGIVQVPFKADLIKTYEDFTITTPKERQLHFGQYDHVRWYGLDYKDRLESVGFTADLRKYGEELGEQKKAKYALMNNDILPVITKD